MNFDLSEGPSLRCEFPDSTLPSYLRMLPFPVRANSSSSQGGDSGFQPLTESILAAQRQVLSRQFAGAMSSPVPIPTVLAPAKRVEEIKHEAAQEDTNMQFESSGAVAAPVSAKGRRGRKKKRITAEAKVLETQKKLEKNREFARQNRRRKKQYINTLENQVRTV